ncbi:unnamed protein product [Lactuca saligna]|uniref:Uncharacterized protein n=1 Tax=Lactuca saligna TaxID=75948 RepID=A0AA35V5Y0_LACSI|nr:unnamed protein product [Lactuca saligna]
MILGSYPNNCISWATPPEYWTDEDFGIALPNNCVEDIFIAKSPNIEGIRIGMPTYMVNRREVYDQIGQHNLHADSMEYICNAQVNPVVNDFEADFDDTDDESDMFADNSNENYDDVTIYNDYYD